jgi:hypothetical protein
MFRSFSSYFAGFNFSGSEKLGVRIDCFKRSVHCRLKLVFIGPSTSQCNTSFPMCKHLTLWDFCRLVCQGSATICWRCTGVTDVLLLKVRHGPVRRRRHARCLRLGTDIPQRIQKAYAGASDCSEWEITHYSSVSELLDRNEAELVRWPHKNLDGLVCPAGRGAM